MKYRFKVVETRRVECEYEVEADNVEDAISKASRGETTWECNHHLTDVLDRDIVDGLNCVLCE